MNVQTENAAIARRIYSLLKDHYQVRSELLVRKKMKLKKNNVYIVRLKQGTKDVLMDLDIMDGMMFNGHVSDEIMGNSQKMRSYLRGAFMASGATNSMLRFEDVRIVRDMRNSVNRLVNCETANLNKTIDAASKQIENIELIEAKVGLHALPEKLQEIAELRLQHPEVSLKELGEMIPSGAISKSGINHRIRKINEFAEKLREEVV